MDNNDNVVMSRIAFERMQSKDERNDRWRNLIIIILIILLVLTNAMWLYAWNQYDYADGYTEIKMDSGEGGNNNYIGNDGDISNGKDDNTQKNENPDKE